ncbi:hypothetical protein AB0333_15890, partial [Citricoccus sp. NPDC079358]|uniref:hypothetical protein n=1 Tax=Citricoccus sp. NPDC079358 TaxID=3154653 RepID=UPI00344BE63B
MNVAIDFIFYLSLTTIVVVSAVYVSILLRAYDDGSLQLFTDESLLRALSQHSLEDIRVLGDMDRLRMAETIESLQHNLTAYNSAGKENVAEVIATIVVDPVKASKYEKKVADIRERGRVAKKEAQSQFVVAVDSAMNTPLLRTVKVYRRAAMRARWKLWRAGFADNAVAVVRGALRYKVMASLVIAGGFLIVGLAKVLMGSRLQVTDAFPTLVVLVSAAAGSFSSPIRVLWQVMSRQMAGLVGDNLEARRNRQLLAVGLPALVFISALIAYFGPHLSLALSALFVNELSRPEATLIPRVFSFLGSLMLVFIIWSLCVDAVRALRPNHPVKARTDTAGASLLMALRNSLPWSARLRLLALTFLLAPLLTLMLAVSLAMSFQPQVLSERLAGPGVEATLIVVSLMMGGGFVLL